MDKSLQEMEDNIMGKCLDELANFKAIFIQYFVLTIKTQANIKELGFTNLSAEMQQRCDKELNGLSEFFRQCIKEMGGIPALVQFDKPGEGLLSNCIVIPTDNPPA